MEFGSEYVYEYQEPSYEYISDEELDMGMQLSESDSNSDEESEDLLVLSKIKEEAPPHCSGPSVLSTANRDTAAPAGGFAPEAPPPPVAAAPPLPSRQKLKKKYHWKSKPMQSTYCQLPPPPPPPPSTGKRVRQADTNIVSIKFNKLIAPSNMHAGDPNSCEECSAILSKISKVAMEGDEKVWTCEFCGKRNIVDVEDEEVPQEDDITFMMEPALSTTASGPSGMDESLVVFCVDVSGSMCVTTEVPGHVDLRGAESLRRLQTMNTDRSDQYLPRQRRDVTYISRLQSVQAAIDHQLEEMSKSFPNRRVALVTFNSEVTVIGDGKHEPVTIVGDKLSDTEKLKTIASEIPTPVAIRSSRQALGQKVFELEEGGPTALGPALQVATTMAAMTPGSKVILCTDGMANVGMGKLDGFKDKEEENESLHFYEDIADYSTEKGVSVSVITIKGTDCKLAHIGRLAEKTRGQVNIVDPLKLTQEFSTILANKIIATNVVATFILHKDLFFLYEDTEESKVVKTIGNVTADTEITFEYGVRTKPEAKSDTASGGENKTKGSDTPEAGSSTSQETKAEKKEEPDRKEIPFQLQITYTDTEGAKALRLLTKTKPVTRDRQKAEQKVNLGLFGRHAAQQSAQLALQGKYTMARDQALMKQRLAWRYTASDDGVAEKRRYKSMFGKIKSVENQINVAQKRERATFGRTHSDSEEEEDFADEMNAALGARSEGAGRSKSVPKPRGKSKSFFSRFQRKKRLNEMSDEVAEEIYDMASATSKFEEEEK